MVTIEEAGGAKEDSVPGSGDQGRRWCGNGAQWAKGAIRVVVMEVELKAEAGVVEEQQQCSAVQ
jgi:hypothetical protein